MAHHESYQSQSSGAAAGAGAGAGASSGASAQTYQKPFIVNLPSSNQPTGD